ncbi:MAG: Clp protease N-terminal domain-containing protein [Acidimicrobiales bacterium]
MWASEEARRRGDRRAGTDHLLLGLLQEPEIEAVLGVSLPEARDRLGRIDREALDALGIAQGIDAPPLRMHPVPKKPTIKAVLQDRIRMTPAAKRVLQDAGRPIRRGKHIAAEHVLVRILDLESPDPAAELLRALGVDSAEVRNRLDYSAP